MPHKYCVVWWSVLYIRNTSCDTVNHPFSYYKYVLKITLTKVSHLIFLVQQWDQYDLADHPTQGPDIQSGQDVGG